MGNNYKYLIDQCDVYDKVALNKYRSKRDEWLSWLSSDEQHAISTLISSMAWSDVAFRTLWHMAEIDPNSCLENPLLAEFLIEGHFATQVLAVRRLMDKRSDVISLRRLLDDLAANVSLFTREIFVCHDGLPYDYEAAEQRVMLEHLGKGAFWGQKSGSDAPWPSKRAHLIFDRLAGVTPAMRRRDDAIPLTRINALLDWLNACGADQLVEWSHKFLAHAADMPSRRKIDIAVARPNLDKISAVLRCFTRVSEAVSAYILFESGHGEIVPVPQFNQFERITSPLMKSDKAEDLHDLWDKLADERNKYLVGVIDDLAPLDSTVPV
ncbi:MAG: hypothetical protein ACYC1L_17880 [Alphaproteobacteria bacterium]